MCVTFSPLSYKQRERQEQWDIIVNEDILLLCKSNFFFLFAYFNCKIPAESCCGLHPTQLTVVVPSHTLLTPLPQASWDLVSQFSASSPTLICNILCAPFIINVPRCVVRCSSCMNWWPHCVLPRGGLCRERSVHIVETHAYPCVCVKMCGAF